MDVKPGHKQTDVGTIPNDWEVKPLGELASISAGGTPSRSIAKYWNGDIPWITTSELDFGTVSQADQFISKEGLNNSAAKILPPGTLLMALYGQGKTRGKVAVLGIEAATNQACAAISLSRGVSSAFVFHFLGSRYEAIRNLSNTGNQENLNSSLVRSIPILLPQTAEQEAIAEALSDADALIESLEQLLAKECQVKQGVLREMLTGNKRLPGFDGQWQKRQLKRIVETPVTDGPHLTPHFLDDGVPFLSVNNLVDNKIDWTELRYISDADHKVFSRKCKPRRGDILLGKAASVGKVAIVDADIDFNVWSPIAVIRPNATHSARFLYYQLQSEDLVRQIALLTNASSQGNIGMGDIEMLTFTLPCKDEQIAIAGILSDIDTELSVLEAKLAKVRQIKQGMMQELLTGRIRLV